MPATPAEATPIDLAHRAGNVSFNWQDQAAKDTQFFTAALQLQTSTGASLLPRRVVAEMWMGVDQSEESPDLGTVPSGDEKPKGGAA